MSPQTRSTLKASVLVSFLAFSVVLQGCNPAMIMQLAGGLIAGLAQSIQNPALRQIATGLAGGLGSAPQNIDQFLQNTAGSIVNQVAGGAFPPGLGGAIGQPGQVPPFGGPQVGLPGNLSTQTRQVLALMQSRGQRVTAQAAGETALVMFGDPRIAQQVAQEVDALLRGQQMGGLPPNGGQLPPIGGPLPAGVPPPGTAQVPGPLPPVAGPLPPAPGPLPPFAGGFPPIFNPFPGTNFPQLPPLFPPPGLPNIFGPNAGLPPGLPAPGSGFPVGPQPPVFIPPPGLPAGVPFPPPPSPGGNGGGVSVNFGFPIGNARIGGNVTVPFRF